MNIFSAFFRTLTSQVFDYSSRTTRRWFFVYTFLASVLCFILMASSRMLVLKILSEDSIPLNIFDYFKLILFTLLLLSMSSITVRRLHDINKSGKLALTMLIPIVNFKYLIAIYSKGTTGENNYGNDPRNNSWML